jgi:hypothetical protein
MVVGFLQEHREFDDPVDPVTNGVG